MASIPIGLQLFSVRKTMDKDYLGTLQKVAETGYKQVEFAIFPYNNGEFEPEYTGKELRKILAGMGLSVVNTMVAFHEKLDWDRIVDYCAELGSVGFCSPIFFYGSRDDVLRRADWLNAMGRKSRAAGLEFYFHNHFMEFQKFGGTYAYDLLLDNTDPDCVWFELDTFWCQRGGMEPVALMDHIGPRLRLLHQKDIAKTARPVNLFEVIPEGTRITYDVFYPLASSQLDFAEVGTGIMDLEGILRKAEDMKSVQCIVIEQDQTILTELESIRISYDTVTAMQKKISG